MSEDEIITNANELIDNCNCYLEDDETDDETFKWFEVEKKTIQSLLGLYQKEKERAERHKQLYLMEKDYQENKLSKYLIDKICKRKIELQQEYKDFEDDIRLNTLEEIHKELLEGNNNEQIK